LILRKVFVLAYNNNGNIELFFPVADVDCENTIKEYYDSEDKAVASWELYKMEHEWCAPVGVFVLTQYRTF